MKTVNVKTIPEDKLQDLYNDEDLTLAAKYVYLMLYFGYEDIDFSDNEYSAAFDELHDKGYINYTSGAVLHTSQKPPVERKPVTNSLTKKTIESKIAESFTDESLKSSFIDFLAMRANIKKPISTSGALTRMINRLKKLSEGDESLADKILDQSIRNNWQDIYPLKDGYRGTSKGSNIERIPYNPENEATDEKGEKIVY